MRLVSVREANIAGIEARIGVAGASSISRTDWASVEGTKSLIGRKGEGEVLQMDISVSIGEDKLLSSLPGRDSIHDKRLFRYGRNSMLYLLVPFLVLLLFNNYKEGKIY